jgi:hypothetical protein
MVAVRLLVLSAVITIVIGAFILPVVKALIIAWVRVYTSFAPLDRRERRRADVFRDIYEQIEDCLKSNYKPAEIAPKLVVRWALGFINDVSWCMPFIPAKVADKVAGWSDNLRHRRVPAAMVAGVAVLLPINYSFFISPANQLLGVKLIANVVIIVFMLLLSNFKHPVARRIFSAWMGIGVAFMMGVILWLSIHLHLYTIPWFQVFSLGILLLVPFMQVVDKAWRDNITSGRRLLFVMCWVLATAASLAGSQIIAGSMMPMFLLWEEFVLFAGIMLAVYGAIAFAAYLLCLLGIRGSAGGLRLVASGIRRLR